MNGGERGRGGAGPRGAPMNGSPRGRGRGGRGGPRGGRGAPRGRGGKPGDSPQPPPRGGGVRGRVQRGGGGRPKPTPPGSPVVKSPLSPRTNGVTPNQHNNNNNNNNTNNSTHSNNNNNNNNNHNTSSTAPSPANRRSGPSDQGDCSIPPKYRHPGTQKLPASPDAPTPPTRSPPNSPPRGPQPAPRQLEQPRAWTSFSASGTRARNSLGTARSRDSLIGGKVIPSSPVTSNVSPSISHRSVTPTGSPAMNIPSHSGASVAPPMCGSPTLNEPTTTTASPTPMLSPPTPNPPASLAPPPTSSTPTPPESSTDDDNKPKKSPEEKAQKRAEMRLRALKEIYTTEQEYIQDLEIMYNVFIFPLQVKKLVENQLLYNIFSNAEAILGCNKEFFASLQQLWPHVDDITPDALIGQAFTKMADYFKMYKVYCANQLTSLNTVEELKKKNNQFKKYLDTCHSDERCRGLFLQSFLIKPIQRVTKYPLLLRELIRFTAEDHPDYQPLLDAEVKVKQVVDNINEGQREFEGLQRIIELQSVIENCPDLVAPGRRLHLEGDVLFHRSSKSKGETRHVFVLSDLILLTVAKGKDKFEHKLSIRVGECKLVVMADTSHLSHAFELEQKDVKGKIIISLPTPKDQQNWVKEIKARIKEFQRKKAQALMEAKKKAAESSPQLGRK